MPEDKETDDSNNLNAFKKLKTQSQVEELLEKIWVKYDNDNSGSLEANELVRFLDNFFEDA